MHGIVSPTEFIRKHFRELLEDGEPHKFKEIFDYINERVREENALGAFLPNQVGLAIYPLLKGETTAYTKVSRGYYQKIGPQLENQESLTFWNKVLDRAFNLQALLQEGFSQDEPMPNMTSIEAQNYKAIGKVTIASIDTAIDGIAAWLAMIDNHAYILEQETPHSATQDMTLDL